ncbi:hypothetical protein FB45DRAFT_1063483 [Roridomyces roridus]|uniref:F-box domain-containing protein n=1 Tax=Roridomyces roridus TaxID=1738132 RepID=A0AAD7FFX5_9AGAR|nr:hypothetical protein FB45DRAFT_1063483 [Roridomyces roridus]
MSFATLDEHVLGEILCFCDIHCVLRFSQVNKYYHHVAFWKHVWISLVRDLEFRGLRDRDPDLELQACTTESLVDMAKRVALGPRTWSPASAVPPTLSREVEVKLGESFEVTDPTLVHLLPGGRHLAVLHILGGFSLWSVATGGCIWTYEAQGLVFFDVDLRHGGDVAVFALSSGSIQGYAWSHLLFSHYRYIEVFKVDLSTGHLFMALRFNLLWRRGHSQKTTLSGDFLLPACLSKSIDTVQVVNWRANTCIRVQLPTIIINAEIVGDHLLVIHGTHDSLLLDVYSLDSFDDWHSDLSSDAPPVTQVPAASLVVPFENVEDTITPHIMIHKHPARRGAYRIIFDSFLSCRNHPLARPKSLVGRVWNKIRTPAIDATKGIRHTFSFISPSNGTPPGLRLVSIAQFDRSPGSSSGYLMELHSYTTGSSAVLLDGYLERDGVSSKERPRRVVQWPRVDGMSYALPSLSVYSAAVVLVEGRMLRILYYQ